MLIVILGIVLIGLSFCAGIFLGKNMAGKSPTNCPSSEETKQEKIIKSPFVKKLNIVITEKISQIQGQTLIFNKGEETLAVPIKNGTSVFSVFAVQPAVPSPPTKIDFGVLKIGDLVSIIVEVKPDGSLEGVNISLLK